MAVVFSFDVEEHHRIEAAARLSVPAGLKREYAARMERATDRLLELLADAGVKATFYVVGELAKSHRRLVRALAEQGHEVGSHGWDHRRVHRFDPAGFAADLWQSVDALQQASGSAVVGYRAPTFSITRQTAWAADVLAASGLRYDTSLFPVRHDRYGVPDAPRTPFRLRGERGEILELPPTTFRLVGPNLPVAGGGYFRLFPLAALRGGVRQHTRMTPAVAMLYFHPWEFDPGQPRLPLGRVARFRTYVGTGRSTGRLAALLQQYKGGRPAGGGRGRRAGGRSGRAAGVRVEAAPPTPGGLSRGAAPSKQPARHRGEAGGRRDEAGRLGHRRQGRVRHVLRHHRDGRAGDVRRRHRRHRGESAGRGHRDHRLWQRQHCHRPVDQARRRVEGHGNPARRQGRAPGRHEPLAAHQMSLAWASGTASLPGLSACP